MVWSKNLDWSVYYQIPDNLREIYLKKLNLEQKAPSRKYLDELVRANLFTIPFENLSTTLWDEPVSLEPSHLIDKILCKPRGAFVLN